ncbi:transposase [Methanofollis formosanus]|uniref:Transposase n=1 Tax=Methanofollis formosanus TaxID=299308 RepID=A0A8G1A4B0_9EURY|nr:transposase [Methanofollis formosanus]
MIEWDAFRPLLADLYSNDAGNGGRPYYDVILMLRLLVLQQWYGLSDPSNREKVLPSSPLLRTERATFTALRSSTSQPEIRAAIWNK